MFVLARAPGGPGSIMGCDVPDLAMPDPVSELPLQPVATLFYTPP